MATCMYCGAPTQVGQKFCTACGAALPVEAPVEETTFEPNAQQPYQQPSCGQPNQQYQQPGQQNQQPAQHYPQHPQAVVQGQPVTDSGSIGWAVLGFFIPLVGLILFLVWRTTKPNCAKMAGIGALVGFCLGLLLNFSTIGLVALH